MLYDKKAKAIDYRFLDVNAVFEKQTGPKNVIGKSGTDVTGKIERSWIETYDSVVKTGERIRFDNYHEIINQWYDVYASRMGMD